MKLCATNTSWVSFFVVISLFAMLFPANLFAAEFTPPSGSFVVRPAKTELEITAGQSVTRVLSLTNTTALPLAVEISFEDVAPSTQASAVDDPIVLLGINEGDYPLKDLLTVEEKSLTILSGQTISVPVQVTIPKSATPSGHYGSVVFTFTPILSRGATGNGNVAVESRLATLFYVRVAGEAIEKGELLEFGLFNNAKTTLSPTSHDPLRLQIAFSNTGTVHLNPYGRLTLTTLLGEAKTILIDPWAVLPGGVRMREVDVHDALRPGYYTVVLEQNRGYDDIVDTREAHFWVLPTIEQTLLLIVSIAFLLFLIRRSLALSRHSVS